MDIMVNGTYHAYEKDTGKSVFILGTEYGAYIGEAYLHPDDATIESPTVGMTIAEKRAYIALYENQKDNLDTEIEELEMLLKEAKQERRLFATARKKAVRDLNKYIEVKSIFQEKLKRKKEGK